MAKKALVTGITGQDGSYLAELLLRKGYEVFGLVRRLSVPNTVNIDTIIERVTLVDGDLGDQGSLARALKQAQPDEVYNLAAQSYVQSSFSQPILTMDVTGTGVLRLLEAVREAAPHARFYQAGSSEMFGKVRETPQTERTPFHPRSPYGVAKVAGHFATVNYREAYGIYAVGGILFNHESPRRGLQFVTRKISYGVARIHAGLQKDITLGSLDAGRDWGYAPEYVEAMWKMLQAPAPDTYVIGTGVTHTVRDFVRAAFAAVDIEDWQPLIKTDPRFMRPAEVNTLLGDAAYAKSQLGWEPQTPFDQLVRIMVDADIERVEAGPR